jgi:hypothetical protein
MMRDGIFNRGYDLIDEYTPFRYLLKIINSRSKRYSDQNDPRKNFLSLSDLKNLWEKQNGICPYSGLNLILPTHSTHNNEKKFLYASVDRIDSSLPYQDGNVQFISRSLNYGKQDMREDDFCKFLQDIKQPSENRKIKNYYLKQDFTFLICYQRIHMREGGHQTYLSSNDLYDLWIKQDGRCAYSKIPLYLAKAKQTKRSSKRDVSEICQHEFASVDRIDSSLPYIKGNIQFVSKTLNLCKGDMSDSLFREFLTYIM